MVSFIRDYLDVIWQFLLYLVLLSTGLASPVDIVIIYAIETVLIGLFHAMRMVVVSFSSTSVETGKGLGLTLFFLAHYNLFTFIQTGFFFSFLASSDDRFEGGMGLKNWETVLGSEGVQWALIVLTITLTARFYIHFLLPGNYHEIRVDRYMFVPYIRIFIQQFVAIIPGLFVIFFDGGYIAALLLIVLRSLLDTWLARMKKKPDYTDKFVHYLMKKGMDAKQKLNPAEIREFLEMVVHY